jgi:hypothetical protein
MSINELRIDNWVKRDSQPEGFQIDINSFRTCDLHPDWYKPIPLTEEWLLKFGFKRRFACNKWFEKSHKGVLLLTNDFNEIKGEAFSTKIEFVFIHDYTPSVRAKYVHQLQNLYFALTGKELTIKP